MVMSFEELKHIVHLHDELESFNKNLLKENKKIGIINDNSDSPGNNYIVYSDNLKNIVSKAIELELTKLEETYKNNLNIY